MKKSAVLIIFISLFFACSNSNENNTPEPLLKHIITVGSTQYYENFTYVGNKLDKITYPDSYKQFAYAGDLIISINWTHTNYGTSYVYTYDTDDRLINIHETNNGEFGAGPTYDTDYQYNTDSTISFATAQNGSAFRSGLISLANGEVSRMVTDFADGSPSQAIDYTSDTKNFFGKNITGYKNIAFTGIIGIDGVNNNTTGKAYTWNTNLVFHYDYTYNADDYPETATITYSDDNIDPVSYTIQYIYE
jgi:hypothetical protein